jgi:hypothetical protein
MAKLQNNSVVIVTIQATVMASLDFDSNGVSSCGRLRFFDLLGIEFCTNDVAFEQHHLTFLRSD